jgi:hypothetical protein
VDVTGSAHQNGLLPIVPAEVVERLWDLPDREPTSPVTVGLENCVVRVDGTEATTVRVGTA